MAKDSRAILAFIFGLIGGVAILVTDLAIYPSLAYYYSFLFGVFGFFLSVVAGVLVLVSAAMVFQKPGQGVIWGTIMIVFGALSIAGTGGFFIGMVLSVVGGALAVVAGAAPLVPGVAPGAQRACLSCGMLFASEFAHCPHCGYRASRPPGDSPPPP